MSVAKAAVVQAALVPFYLEKTLKFHRTTPDGKREVVELKGE